MDKEIKSPVKETPTIGSNGVILVAFFNKLVVEQGCYRQRFLLFFFFCFGVNLIEVNLRQIAVEVRL